MQSIRETFTTGSFKSLALSRLIVFSNGVALGDTKSNSYSLVYIILYSLSNMNIGEAAYWDERYKIEMAKLVGFELFDWYCPFSEIYHMIEGCFDSTAVHKVLVIGVGRSDVIDHLYRRGFRDITAIDISNTIIVEMQKKYSSYTGVEFFVMDTKQLMKFSMNSFTLVIDKACMDSLFCGTDYMEATQLAMSEIFRVMKQDGVFVSVSHGSKLSRVPYFRAIPWAIDCYKVPSDIGEHLTLYVLTKTSNQDLINMKIAGAEATFQAKSSHVVSNLDQNMNKGSTTRTGQNTGSITVTASVDALAEMVAESAEVDT
jgi:ubiquinone/menaquinone biosynthesis C-methylase UbiE